MRELEITRDFIKKQDPSLSYDYSANRKIGKTGFSTNFKIERLIDGKPLTLVFQEALD